MKITLTAQLIQAEETTSNGNTRVSLSFLDMDDRPEVRNFKAPKGMPLSNFDKHIGKSFDLNINVYDVNGKIGFFIRDPKDITPSQNSVKAVS